MRQSAQHEDLVDLVGLQSGVFQGFATDHLDRFDQRLRQHDVHPALGTELDAQRLALLAQHRIAEPVLEQLALVLARDLMGEGLDQTAVEPVRADGRVHAATERAHRARLEHQHGGLDLPAAHVDENRQSGGAVIHQVGQRGQRGRNLRAHQVHAGTLRGRGERTARLGRGPRRARQGHAIDRTARRDLGRQDGLSEQAGDQRLGFVQVLAQPDRGAAQMTSGAEEHLVRRDEEMRACRGADHGAVVRVANDRRDVGQTVEGQHGHSSALVRDSHVQPGTADVHAKNRHTDPQTPS